MVAFEELVGEVGDSCSCGWKGWVKLDSGLAGESWKGSWSWAGGGTKEPEESAVPPCGCESGAASTADVQTGPPND